MVRAFFYNLFKKAIQELLEGTLKDIRREVAESHADLVGRIDKLVGRLDALQDSQLAMQRDLIGRIDKVNADLTARIDRLSTRMDDLSVRMDGLSVRMDDLSSRMDDLTREQTRLAEGIAELKTERSVTADILHRLEKIEDKVYA